MGITNSNLNVSGPVTVDSIRRAISSALATERLPVSELIQIIASYAAPFVSSAFEFADSSGLGPLPLVYSSCANLDLDSNENQIIIVRHHRTRQFFKFSVRTGTYNNRDRSVQLGGLMGASAIECSFALCLAAHAQVQSGPGVRNISAMGSRTRSTVSFGLPRAVCRDPLNPNGWYLCDPTSIRYFDQAKDQVTLFAGCGSSGSGEEAGGGGLNDLSSLVITSDGKTIWLNSTATNRYRHAQNQNLSKCRDT